MAGTGTEVGKTWVASGLARRLQSAGLTVAARKPAQSDSPGTDEEETDAGRLAAATGATPGEVCPRHRWYPLAMAPPMAADALGREPVRVADLAAETTWPPSVEVGLVETAGGVRSPLAHDGDTVALGLEIRPDAVLLVAPAGLGVLHAVRVCADALAPLLTPARPLLVYLNHHDEADDLHRRNRRWLAERWGLAVCTDLDRLAAAILARRL